jgi:hypothetical protein
MSYDPKSRIPDDGTITTAKLGGDVTTLAKDLLTQATTTDAKNTLAVTDGGGGGVPAITL